MTLYINTVSADEMTVALRDGVKIIARKVIAARRRQGEKLIPAIAALLKKKKLKLSALDDVVVASRGGSFTSLRIGVIAANALAYALNIPVRAEVPAPGRRKKFGRHALVEAIYDRAPDIGKPKKFGL